MSTKQQPFHESHSETELTDFCLFLYLLKSTESVSSQSDPGLISLRPCRSWQRPFPWSEPPGPSESTESQDLIHSAGVSVDGQNRAKIV